MKKIIISLSVVGLLLAGVASAQMDMMMGSQNNMPAITQQTPTLTISAALQAIYNSQNITSSQSVDCSKISDDQFEKLGDAYMGNGITEAQHTAMENMMGGEGSTMVKQTHISMGRAYIGCWTGYTTPTRPMMSMMYNNSSTNGYDTTYHFRGGMMNRSSMTGDYNEEFDVVSWITVILVWILLASVIFVLWKHIKAEK